MTEMNAWFPFESGTHLNVSFLLRMQKSRIECLNFLTMSLHLVTTALYALSSMFMSSVFLNQHSSCLQQAISLFLISCLIMHEICYKRVMLSLCVIWTEVQELESFELASSRQCSVSSMDKLFWHVRHLVSPYEIIISHCLELINTFLDIQHVMLY